MGITTALSNVHSYTGRYLCIENTTILHFPLLHPSNEPMPNYLLFQSLSAQQHILRMTVGYLLEEDKDPEALRHLYFIVYRNDIYCLIQDFIFQ